MRGTQEILASLPKHIKVVDLSADFRLRNVDTYAEWCAPRAEDPSASFPVLPGATTSRSSSGQLPELQVQRCLP